MWEESAGKDSASMQEAVFNELHHECQHSAPGARLSARLRTALERMAPAERRAVTARTRDGCAPLFVASRRGNVEIVEYLVHVCAADLEQRGVYEVPDDRSVHQVTPLWAAAVAGHAAAVRALADAGADVDAGSDSGSTPVRSACFMTHLDVVRLLVERGADIHRPNHNGGTCLINAVQSVRLCTFLLQRGAAVDARDMQLKTALHYAIQEHRAETARLLLEHGASPHLRSRAGDDALRTASLKGAAHVVLLLAARVAYAPARLADGFELLGATQLDEFNDAAAALAAWRRATAIRHAAGGYVPKRPARPPSAALGGAREWRSLAELERGGELPAHADVLRVFGALAAALPAARRALDVRPVYRKQADTFDRALRCVTHLLHLLLETASRAQMAGVRAAVRRLVEADVRSAHTGDTLLHLCVSRLNVIRSTYFAEELAVTPIFPSVAVVRLLVECGAPVGVRNEARSTPLHVAAIPYNFSTELVEELLAGGAHLDQPNKFGDSPAELVALNRGSRVRVLQHVSLACLAARALLAAYSPPHPHCPPHPRLPPLPAAALPATLHRFLDLHRP